MNRQISISDAEWTIMKALWQSEDKKMTLKEIAEAVADVGWSYTTVRTMVGRLVEKEAIAADESHPRNFLYSAAVTEEACRKEDADNSTLKVAKLLMNPFLANIVVWLARVLDRYGIMPRWLLNASPFHTSMFVTNMASIGLPAIQHHIYNFGTCSQFVSIGSVERGVALDAKGNVVRKRLLPLGVVCDERICEGAMYAKMLSIMGRLLNNPEQLEQPPERVLYDEGHEFHLPEPKRHRFFRKGKEESVQA